MRFQYECHDRDGQWWRSYGNELWEFDEHGLMRRREASINDLAIAESERRIFGPRRRARARRRDPAAVTMAIEVTLFTDPACPFAFSAEPARQRLRWHYGEGLRWEVRMIVLTLETGEAEKLAEGAAGLQRRYGMPIVPEPYPRPASSEPACLAVVAARLHAPGTEQALLRALRVRTMAGGLLDDPELIVSAARDAGLDPRRSADGPARPRLARRSTRTSRWRETRPPPPGRLTTSSADRGTSAATPRPATSCAVPMAPATRVDPWL